MPCAARMSIRTDDEPGTGCKATCLHRRLVGDYRIERGRQESAAEEASIGYQTELEEYLASNPLITFKEWLIGHRRPQEGERAA